MENHATSADEPFSSLAYLGKRPRKIRINQKKKKKRCKWKRYYNSRLLRKTSKRTEKKLRKQNQLTSSESRSQKRGGYEIRTKADKYFLYTNGIIDQIEFNKKS